MGVKQGGEQANEADNKPPRYEDTDKFLDFVGGGFKKGFYDGSIHKRLEYCEAKKSKQIVERDNGEAQIFQDCAYVPHGAEQGGKQTATDVNEGECDGKVEPIGLIEKWNDGVDCCQGREAPEVEWVRGKVFFRIVSIRDMVNRDEM